jgi:hypothetical protein
VVRMLASEERGSLHPCHEEYLCALLWPRGLNTPEKSSLGRIKNFAQNTHKCNYRHVIKWSFYVPPTNMQANRSSSNWQSTTATWDREHLREAAGEDLAT